jgi:Fe-S-cluster containining protein
MDPSDIEKETRTLFVPLEKEQFRFSCHRGLSCFTACCVKLRLILTPYDILRLKNRLGLSSDEFLERYTETVFDEGKRFPLIRLKMKHEEGRCPFLLAEGCSVYGDRPGACRLYPVGRASARPNGLSQIKERFFIVREPHCLGFNEEKLWSIEEWTSHEGLSEYQRSNDSWLAIVTSSDSIGDAEQAQRKYQMFFMASYNLDRFRAFLFNSRFFERFRVEPSLKERLAVDDEALLDFAFEWLALSLYGKKTRSISVDL